MSKKLFTILGSIIFFCAVFIFGWYSEKDSINIEDSKRTRITSNYQVKVNYEYSLDEALLAAGVSQNNLYNHSNVIGQNPWFVSNLVDGSEDVTLNFFENTSSQSAIDVLETISNNNKKPANIDETLAFLAQHPNILGENDTVVALGTVFNQKYWANADSKIRYSDMRISPCIKGKFQNRILTGCELVKKYNSTYYILTSNRKFE